MPTNIMEEYFDITYCNLEILWKKLVLYVSHETHAEIDPEQLKHIEII